VCADPALAPFPFSADNYTEPIHGGLELESNPPYLMYTHGNDEVRPLHMMNITLQLLPLHKRLHAGGCCGCCGVLSCPVGMRLC
jgi:hypothetical protein